MNIDLFVPLLALFTAIVLALWLANYYSLDIVWGWRGILTFVFIVLGIRVNLLHNQLKKQEEELKETSEWVEKAIIRRYNGFSDSSGGIFIHFANIFELKAVLPQSVLDKFSSDVEQLKKERPLDGLRMPDLIKRMDLEMAYNSNAIEGNPLSFRETSMILAGFVGGGFVKRKLRDVYDILGHHKAFFLAQELASNGSAISLDHILMLHKMVLHESQDGGVLRKSGEIAVICGKKVLFAMPDEIEALLQNFVAWLSDESKKMHPFLLAVECHTIFVKIHPFRDGNGRMARLLANIVLLQHGYPPLIVQVKNRDLYMKTIQDWNEGDSRGLTSCFASFMQNSFEIYFQALNIAQ
jgi:fido (protein-threonine AMPylation protein)